MINTLKKLLGIGPSINYAEFIKQGAILLDVRTKGEYQSGNIDCSINIPLNELTQKISELKKDQTIITCCASGVRSAAAKRILKSNGFGYVHNGGGWSKLQNKLN